MLLGLDDEVSVRDGSANRTYFKDLRAMAEERTIPDWVSRDLKLLSGKVSRLPERIEIDGNLNEQLIVEYYSQR
jgi:small subunit ribosomal protein S4